MKNFSSFLIACICFLFGAMSVNAQCPPGDVVLNTQQDVIDFQANYPNCTEINGTLRISTLSNYNDPIIDINGLSQITTVAGSLQITNNGSLDNLSGLDNIVSLGSYLHIFFNNITNINNLSSLENVSDITIYSNPELTDINGLDNVDFSGVYLSIQLNSSLATCNVDYLCTLLNDPSGLFDINNNADGCSSNAQILSSCGVTCPGGNITMRSQSEVDEFAVLFPTCTNIPGNLTIQASYNEIINNLSNLSQITEVGGRLKVSNTSVTSLSGIHNLSAINGRLDITDNNELTDLSGLENIELTAGPIYIQNNSNLESLYGIHNISTMAPGLYIQDNSSLSICQNTSICNYLLNGNNATISGNAPGCNSRDEVETLCDSYDPDDLDGDGISNDTDNCPYATNPNQEDMDNDGQGDACDNDIDGDGVINADDCNPTDANISTENTYYADADGDGFGDSSSTMMACTQPTGYVTNNTDCDDSNANINPDATEIPGNGIDEDCDGSDASLPDGDGDGVADATDNCPSVANPNQEDMDNDGQGDACDNDIDGDGVINADDCNPTDANISTENTYYADADGDGFGDSSSTMMACTQPTGFVTNNTDCDDSNANINPDATEIPGNGIDEDCDGSDASLPDGDGDGIADATDNCPSVANPNQEDMDNDGQGDACDNDIDGDGVVNADDCNPNDANISTENTYYADADGDGFGDSSSTMMACTQPTGYVSNNTDCDDSDANVNPDATEIPGNGIDEDCDGSDASLPDGDGDGVADATDNCPSVANPNQEDMDNDGQGDACDNDIDGDGVINSDDCNPTDANISTENTYYADADGDGFGDSLNTMMACTQPTGYVSNNTDCDDSNANINPDATEVPGNGIDEDCDGVDGSTGNNDMDGDGIADSIDNCPNTANPNQEDGNGDGVGDHCEACDLPYMVELTRTGDTTATFDAGNSVWHYQGTANRAGRPLRPYPMYGMGDMTVVHTQYNLVPAFDYSVWLRTICGNGMYSDWAGPFYLPTYNGNLRNQKAISLTPNPAISIVKLSKVETRTIEIYDLNGTLVLHVDTEDNQFDVSSLQTGKYNLKIMDAEGNVHYEQLIKK